MTNPNNQLPNVHYNPIRITDFERSLVYGTILLIIGTIIYLLSNNTKILIIFSILVPMLYLGYFLPYYFFKPKYLLLDADEIILKTRPIGERRFSYESIEYVVLENHIKENRRYGGIKIQYRSIGYIISYEAALALRSAYQAKTGHDIPCYDPATLRSLGN